MAVAALRSEERFGLALAVVAHAGLIAVLALRPSDAPPPVPQRLQVTLADDVGLTATSPDPQAKAAPDLAPSLGEAQPVAQPQPVAKPEPVPPAPKPAPSPPPLPPRPVVVQRPVPVPKPAPKPVVKPAPPLVKPRPVPDPIAAVIAARQAARIPLPPKPVARQVAKSATMPVVDPIGAAIGSNRADTARKTRQPEGGSRIGADFLKGAGATTSGKSPKAGAAVAGPAVRSALAGAISRQLKPHWRVPQGVDTDQLVTILSFDLNRDGTLVGTPRLIRQEGITESNQRQAARHLEQAIRAVQLSAPFPLPAEYYEAWKHLTNVRFDRNLSQ